MAFQLSISLVVKIILLLIILALIAYVALFIKQNGVESIGNIVGGVLNILGVS